MSNRGNINGTEIRNFCTDTKIRVLLHLPKMILNLDYILVSNESVGV